MPAKPNQMPCRLIALTPEAWAAIDHARGADDEDGPHESTASVIETAIRRHKPVKAAAEDLGLTWQERPGRGAQPKAKA